MISNNSIVLLTSPHLPTTCAHAYALEGVFVTCDSNYMYSYEYHGYGCVTRTFSLFFTGKFLYQVNIELSTF